MPNRHLLGVNERVQRRLNAFWLMTNHIEMAVVVAGVVAGLLYMLGAVINPYHDSVGSLLSFVPVTVVVGWSFLFVGLVATKRRPGNRVGLLMSLFGVTWFSSGVIWIDTPQTIALGESLRVSYLAVLAHLLIVYPSGRGSGRLDRFAIVGVYAYFVVITIATNVTQAAVNFSVVTTSLVAGLVVAIVIRHWVRASRPARRALAPAMWAALPILVVVLAFQVATAGLLPDSVLKVIGPIEEAIFAVLPIGLLIGLLRTRLGRAAVTDLVVNLSRAPIHGTLRDMLARALGDPSLELALALPGGGYVDVQGRAVTLPPHGSGRAVTAIAADGKPLAALVHDPALDEEDAGLVAAAGSAAQLALENERLQAEVRASLVEVRASRARIQEAADAERRRLERDIHDGAQQRLVALALGLRLARDRASALGDGGLVTNLDDALGQLKQALREIRELAQGVHPAVLTRAGIAPALRSLAESSAVPVEITDVPLERYPEQTEAAVYFVVSEALTNAAKHAGASRVELSVRRQGANLQVEIRDDGSGGANPALGSGLVGLADRVAVLGGHLEISSPPGAGTLVHADIPCE
jgi:signal transduction histidine kinase